MLKFDVINFNSKQKHLQTFDKILFVFYFSILTYSLNYNETIGTFDNFKTLSDFIEILL